MTSTSPTPVDAPGPLDPAAPPAEPAAPTAESADQLNATEQLEPDSTALKRLMAWIVPANFSIFMLWGAIPAILLPQQLTVFDAENKVANLALVGTIGALIAMIAQPVAGQISDRTRSRFGRRAPWMILGALAGGLALVGLAFANSLVGIIIAWSIVQMSYNFSQGPLSAVLPDRVPVSRRGTFSALSGLGLMAGSLGGQIIGSLFFNSIAAGYVTFAVVVIVVLAAFTWANPDRSSEHLETEPFRLGDFLRTFWVNPVKHPDFAWAFLGRLLLYTGYFAVTGYQLFILTDYIGVASPERLIPILGVISLTGMVIATLISGPMSDRLGRRKVFVVGSSIVLAAGLVIPWLVPTQFGWIAMTAIGGLGFGIYQAVDTALMSEVLPSAGSYAKDLGVVNIAATLPQTLAPGVAGAIVLSSGYAALFPISIALSVLGALAILPIKAVR